jgi:hypothetical protein
MAVTCVKAIVTFFTCTAVEGAAQKVIGQITAGEILATVRV